MCVCCQQCSTQGASLAPLLAECFFNHSTIESKTIECTQLHPRPSPGFHGATGAASCLEAFHGTAHARRTAHRVQNSKLHLSDVWSDRGLGGSSAKRRSRNHLMGFSKWSAHLFRGFQSGSGYLQRPSTPRRTIIPQALYLSWPPQKSRTVFVSFR